MKRLRSITIAGGGLAGLTLGIGLRQLGVPVTVHEAGTYPRHRVCGEFISGRGQASLDRLGLRETLLKAGARVAASAAFFTEHQSSNPWVLPEPALCLSRYSMDASLAAEFQAIGGVLVQNHRHPNFELPEGKVRANGRHSRPVERGWRFFGLKVHARGVRLQADLEMHFTRHGYVGLCRLNEDVVNVCGLFRSGATQPNLAAAWPSWLGGEAGSLLHERLAAATFEKKSFCAVAGIGLAPGADVKRDLLCVGDALTMIPPITGNGMSMAFESAELAMEPLAAYSKGALAWQGAVHEVWRRCDEAFASRLRAASLLQPALFNPMAKWLLLRIAGCWRGAWPILFRLTR